jgi:two-component system response regulator HydG
MSKRILIVDDDRQMVRTLSDILRLRGWDVQGAFSGEEAVECVAVQHYDAVLMDVRMTGMTGVDALKAMKARRPGIRVILMTAYAANELIAEGERQGALRVLSKPVALPGLLELLDQAATESRSVLLVDDDPDYLRTLSAILRSRNYAVFEAAGLEDALRKLQQASPAAVVLDLRLNNVDPRDSILAIKHVSPAIALILYSGHSPALEDVAASVPESWVYASLHKPFHPERLMELLNEIIVG